MATVNLIDAFWLEVVPLAIKVGSQDLAIGNAARFFRYAQEKHKQGKLITESEFKSQGFLEDLVPIFAVRTPDGIMAVGAEKHFGWLRKRVVAGSQGGKKSGESRRSNSNNLRRSKTKQNEANASKPNPFPYSYTFPYSDSDKELGGVGDPPPPAMMHWLGELWNQHSGPNLAKLKKTNAHLKNIQKRLKEEPEKEYWTKVIQRIAKSNFLNGKGGGDRAFLATFSWMIQNDKQGTPNHVKVMDGNYDGSKNAQQAESAAQFAGLGE